MNETLAQLHRERTNRSVKYKAINIDNHIFEVLEKPGAAVGSILWEGGQELSVFLYRNPGLIREKSVLELGAGIGLASIIASLYASRVVCTDKQEVLEIALENIKKNNANVEIQELW